MSRLDPEINRRSRAAFGALVQVAAEHGWGEYRVAAVRRRSRDRRVFVQRSRAAAILRDAEGRGRSERHHRRRPRRHLAEALARKTRMRRWPLACLIAAASSCGALALAQVPDARAARDRPGASRSYEYWCLPCHGPGLGLPGFDGLPGTQQLSIKYRDTTISPLLVERTDLVPGFRQSHRAPGRVVHAAVSQDGDQRRRPRSARRIPRTQQFSECGTTALSASGFIANGCRAARASVVERPAQRDLLPRHADARATRSVHNGL